MPNQRRRWGFRLAALALALSPWLIAELSLRLAGWPTTDELRDPFIGFDSQRTLFELDLQEQTYRIADERLVYFRPDEFPAKKADNEFRIFVVGGSTVQGRPYACETAFSTWLKLALEAADSSRSWTVVNCGGISYASYRLVPIIQELLDYEPDLIILCTGNNEFLERRTYRDYLAQPRWQRQLGGWIRQSAVVRAGQSLLKSEPVVEKLPTEVDAQLDYQNALQHYQRDDDWTAAVEEHFAHSLDRIGTMTRSQSVPVWLVLPLTNLRDCPPFKTQASVDNEPLVEQLNSTLADSWFEKPLSQRKEFLEQIIKQDQRLALAHYWLGHCYDEQADFELAKAAYQRAVNEDICPLRVTGPLMQLLKERAEHWDWPVIDAPALLATECRGEILDSTVLDDHVHPNIHSHQRIGRKLFERVAAEQNLPINSATDSRIAERFGEQMVELPAAYFEHGQERLKALNLWARGRAIGAKPAPEPNEP